MAATTRITARQRSLFLARLREGDSLEQAAREATGKPGSRRSFHRLRQADEKFAVEVADAQDSGIDMLEQRLVDIATGKVEVRNMAQVTACFGVLRARRPAVWRESHRPEQQARRPLAQLDVARLTERERAKLRELLEAALPDAAG